MDQKVLKEGGRHQKSGGVTGGGERAMHEEQDKYVKLMYSVTTETQHCVNIPHNSIALYILLTILQALLHQIKRQSTGNTNTLPSWQVPGGRGELVGHCKRK